MAYCERLGKECSYSDLYEKINGETVLEKYNTPTFIEEIFEMEHPKAGTLGEICTSTAKRVEEILGQTISANLCGLASLAIAEHFSNRQEQPNAS